MQPVLPLEAQRPDEGAVRPSRSVRDLYDAPVVILDDDEQVGRLLERILARAGHRRIARTADPVRAVELCDELDADLLITDLWMPGFDGFQLLSQLLPDAAAEDHIPVLVMTGDCDQISKHRALDLGARDFVTKPFDAREVELRVRNLLTTRVLQRQLRNENRMLRVAAETGHADLARTRLEVTRHLALAAECRDDDTHAHTERVSRCSAALARQLGLPADYVELIRLAAPLHDVGKIGIPDSILLKPGRLTREEFEIMKTHTVLGASILANSGIPELQLAHRIALTHHERWDGTGYPNGLRGDLIDIAGRIVAVADVFDALINTRPYKPAWPIEDAVAEIRDQRGRHFDPEVVEAFLQLDGDSLSVAEDVPAA